MIQAVRRRLYQQLPSYYCLIVKNSFVLLSLVTAVIPKVPDIPTGILSASTTCEKTSKAQYYIMLCSSWSCICSSVGTCGSEVLF